MPKSLKKIRQPIDLGDGRCHPRSQKSGLICMLRPGAFFWHAGRLYVGYSWLSRLHSGEEPLWDPFPISLGGVIETCNGYYHFSNLFTEGSPYFRKYAELSICYIHKPDDFGNGFLSRKINQGTFEINEKIVLPPDHYLEHQWPTPLLHREWKNGENLERRIRRAPSLDRMRNSRKARKFWHQFTAEDTCIHGFLPAK